MRIAMLLHKSIEHDSRVRREARALAAAGHDMTVLHMPRVRGDHDGETDGFTVRSVTPPPWVRRRLPSALYRSVFLCAFLLGILRHRPDVVHAHDAAMLAPGFPGAWIAGSKLVYDSHEYAAGVPYRESLWAHGVRALEWFVVPRSDALITVSGGIAQRLRLDHRLDTDPVVVRNLPDPQDTDPEFVAPSIRDQLGLDPVVPIVMHLGAAASGRGCERLVKAMETVPDAHLLFLGADDSSFAESLAAIAGERSFGSRVHFFPPVPVREIRGYVSQADVGVSLLEDTCENHRLALPNKVFEYMEAGIPVVVSDLPELARLVSEQGYGVTTDPSASPLELAEKLKAMIYLARSDIGSPDPPHWREDRERLTALYGDLQHYR